MLTEQQLVSYLPDIRRMALKYDRPNADDLAQTAALRCWEIRMKFTGQDDREARLWMSAVAFQMFRLARLNERRMASVFAREVDISRVAASTPERADRLVELGETHALVDAHPDGKIVRFVAEETAGAPGGHVAAYSAAARRYGMRAECARKRVSRARKAIRAQMEAA